jgi:type IV pilus assembly protein PilN
MRVDINLATHPYEDARQFWFRWGGALLALGIVTLGLLYFTLMGWLGARKDQALMRQYRAQIAARDKETADAQAMMNLPQNASTRDRSQYLNDLFYRKAFSWTRVFEEMEQVMPAGLHVVSITPELASDNELTIKLVVAGNSRDRAIELARKMEESQHFRQTEITSESNERGQGANSTDTVKFEISAFYVPTVDVSSQAGGAQ